MTRTAFGLKLRVVGANARAAIHAGLPVPRLTVAVFAISAALAGLAGGVEILGVQGNVRADWNPAYGLTVVPLVFLARFNGFASIAFVFLFSVLSIGGESAARRLGVPELFHPGRRVGAFDPAGARRICRQPLPAESSELSGAGPLHRCLPDLAGARRDHRGRPAASCRPGRADLGEGGRSQHRHRRHDARRRLLRLPRRLR